METAPPRPRPPRRPAPARARRARRRPLPPVLRDWRAAVGLAALLAAAALALTQLGGGAAERPPADRAAALAPADTLVWVHVSTDGERAAVARALRLLRRAGAETELRAQLTRLVRPGDAEGAPLDVARDVAPWLGDEAALAIAPGRGTTAASLLLLAVDAEDVPAARAFLARGAGTPRQATHRGVALTRYRNGTAIAHVAGFLAVGREAAVRAVIARARRGGERPAPGSLAADPVYRRARAGAPADRVLDLYASVDGVRRLLAPQPGLLGLLGALLDQRGLRGTAVAVAADERRARVRAHAVLDGAQRTAAPRFTPTLTRHVPADALAYAGFAGLERAAPALLGLGGARGLGDTGALLAQAGRLLRAAGVDVARDLLPLFGDEVAVVALPGEGGAPSLALLAQTADGARTRAALRRLEPAVAQLFAPPGGAAPAWGDGRAGATPVRRLAPADGVELVYAVLGDRVAVAASTAAVGALARPGATMDGDPEYRATVQDSPRPTTTVVFLNFGQLLSSLGELGLTGASGADAGLLERVRAVGLAATSEENQSTAELTLEIS